jgi:hypothetical protein
MPGSPRREPKECGSVSGGVTRIPSPHGSGFPATGHGGQRPPLRSATTVGGRRCRGWRTPDAGKPEARAEGMRFRFQWSDAYSLTSRFGLPSNRARRSETTATEGPSKPPAPRTNQRQARRAGLIAVATVVAEALSEPRPRWRGSRESKRAGLIAAATRGRGGAKRAEATRETCLWMWRHRRRRKRRHRPGKPLAFPAVDQVGKGQGWLCPREFSTAALSSR